MSGSNFSAALFLWVGFMFFGGVAVGLGLGPSPITLAIAFSVVWIVLSTRWAWKLGTQFQEVDNKRTSA